MNKKFKHKNHSKSKLPNGYVIGCSDLFSCFSLDCVKSHFPRFFGINSRNESNSDGYLGIMGYDYCLLTEVIRAAESKGVRLLKSDLVDNKSERINQGVMIFWGATAQLVDAIYDSRVSGSAIEKILQSLHGFRLSHGRVMHWRHIINDAGNSFVIGGHNFKENVKFTRSDGSVEWTVKVLIV